LAQVTLRQIRSLFGNEAEFIGSLALVIIMPEYGNNEVIADGHQRRLHVDDTGGILPAEWGCLDLEQLNRSLSDWDCNLQQNLARCKRTIN
jgi:hypothetical protein